MIEFDFNQFEEVQDELRLLIGKKIGKEYKEDTLILATSAVLRALIKRRGQDKEVVDAVEAILWSEDV